MRKEAGSLQKMERHWAQAAASRREGARPTPCLEPSDPIWGYGCSG